MKKIIAILMFVLVGVLSMGMSPAQAAGSDGPVPYTLDTEGLTLPGNDVFEANGHVNIEYLVNGVEKSKNIHFDPNNNQPGGHWIGHNFIPWSAFDPDLQCVKWVQIDGYNEHYGEGGQGLFCIQKPPTSPPSNSEERVRDTTVNCEERTVSWVKESREEVFEYDWNQAKWVHDTWKDWVQVDSGFRNEKSTQCDDIPVVGSELNLWMLGAALLMLIGGSTAVVVSRKN